MSTTRSGAFFTWDGGVTTLDAQFHWPGMAASHLIVDGGGRAAFVDVGTSHTASVLLAALRERDIAPEQVDYVLVTHIHLDHAGGAGALMRSLPNARLVVHPRGARHMVDPSRLVAGASAVYGRATLDQVYGEIVPVDAQRVVEGTDGLELALGRRTLRLMDTPGHARHHFSVVDEAADAVFTGDAFGLSYRAFDTARGPFIFPSTSPVHFDPEAMHHTVDRIVATSRSWVFLTHYGRIGDVQARASELHVLIDRFVALSLEHADAGKRRHRLIVRGIWSIFLEILESHGCTLEKREVQRRLGIDVELNAQGLEVWLDRR